MNQLDELLSETARVDDITPAARQQGHAALEAAIASRSAARSSAVEPRPHPARRPRRSRRGLVMAASVAAVAAVTAGIVVSVVPGPARTSLTAAVVLHHAAQAAGQQPGGWPDAAYWHVTSIYETDGKYHHREVWISHHARTILEDDGVFGSMTPQAGFGGFQVGDKDLSWDQVYALPTDPAQLKPVLLADVKGSYPGGAAGLFEAVGDLLRESPAPPALRKALYEIAARIPGVRLVGPSKDVLGRTGTAVERGDETFLIDTANGQLLADTSGNPRTGLPCGHGQDCTIYGAAYTYTSQGPAAKAPALP